MSFANRLSEIHFTVIYVQTISTTKSGGDVVAVGCAKIRDFRVTERMQVLLNPGVPLPEEFTRRTGIYSGALDQQPTLDEALPDLATFVGRDVLVWAPSSQKSTPVHRHFRLTQARDRQFYLQALAEKALPELPRHHLNTLAAHFGLHAVEAFSPAERADLAGQLWIQLLSRLAETQQVEDLNSLLNFCPAANARTFRTRKDLAFDKEKLKLYPTQPGVYFMKNRLGEILYVGKAKNLRNRLRSYFQKQSRLPAKIAAMMKQVAMIDVTVVGSELEALLLESRLIKQHMPFFNKKIKDFKRMVFLKVSLNQTFPRISDASETDDPSAAYFGPFAGKSILRYKLEILNRVFKLRDCSEKKFADHRQSPCMQYHLGFCSGPCAGLISQETYQDGVADFLRYLEQQPSHAVEHLISKRDAYIEELKFEKAAALQQQWDLMERLQLQNYVLRRALEEHHCLIILPDIQPESRRILTVIYGQPVYWDSVSPALYDQAENSRLEALVGRALKAMAAPREVNNGVNIAKVLHEESRLISQWLDKHTESDGSVIYIKNKSERQLLSELWLALSPQTDPVQAMAGQLEYGDEDHTDTDEAWAWEQVQEGF
jgi:DNA polymerase-3 subunit epsilon